MKTIHNINSYYDLKINQLFEKGDAIEQKNSPIILIGFMGTGKSTIGEYLSLEKQLSFIDLDVYIEIKENKTIPEIFEEVGEIGFRKIEYNYLTECTKNTMLLQQVVALSNILNH